MKTIDPTGVYLFLDTSDPVMVFWRNLYLSFSNNRIHLLLTGIALTTLFYFGMQIKGTVYRPLDALTVLIAIIFSACQFIALCYKKYGTMRVVLEAEDPVIPFRAILKYGAMAVVAYYVFIVFLEIVDKNFTQKRAGKTRPDLSIFFISAGLFFIAFLPYFLIFYPGTSNEDTTLQIMQYFNVKSYIHDMTPLRGDEVQYTNHHPYIETLIFGGFAKLGLVLGDIRRGVALYIFLHMICTCLVFALGICYLLRAGVTLRRTVLVQGIVMILPIFPMYSICMIKDTIYSAFFFIMTLMIAEMVRTNFKVLKDMRFLVAFSVNAFLFMMSKVYGKHVLICTVAVIVVVLLVRARKLSSSGSLSGTARLLITTLIPLIIFRLYISVLLPALGVAPGGIQEALSVPFQQTARYVTEYGDEVTKKEKKAISAVLPYKKLAKLYNPELSDPVKNKYNQDATKEDLKAYFKVWYKMGKKQPLCYLEAFLHNTYMYVDMSKKARMEYYKMDTFIQDHPKTYPPEEYSWLYIENPPETASMRYAVNQIILIIQKVPFLNFFVSLGMLPWILGFFAILSIKRRKPKDILILLPAFLTIALCLLSPVNGSSRYAMPIFYMLPYFVVLFADHPVRNDNMFS